MTPDKLGGKLDRTKAMCRGIDLSQIAHAVKGEYKKLTR